MFDFNDDITKPKKGHKVSKDNTQPPTAEGLQEQVEAIKQAKEAHKRTQERDNQVFQTFTYFCLYGNNENQIRAFSEALRTQAGGNSLMDEADDGEHLVNVMALAGLVQDLCREVKEYTQQGKEHPAIKLYDTLKHKVKDSYIPVPKPFRQIAGLLDDDVLGEFAQGNDFEF